MENCCTLQEKIQNNEMKRNDILIILFSTDYPDDYAYFKVLAKANRIFRVFKRAKARSYC